MDKPNIRKYCTILLIDDIHIGRIFISEKNVYHIRYNDDDDDDCVELVYYKILNNFERFVLVKMNIVNLINDDKFRHNLTLLVDHTRIFICEIKNKYFY